MHVSTSDCRMFPQPHSLHSSPSPQGRAQANRRSGAQRQKRALGLAHPRLTSHDWTRLLVLNAHSEISFIFHRNACNVRCGMGVASPRLPITDLSLSDIFFQSTFVRQGRESRLCATWNTTNKNDLQKKGTFLCKAKRQGLKHPLRSMCARACFSKYTQVTVSQ